MESDWWLMSMFFVCVVGGQLEDKNILKIALWWSLHNSMNLLKNSELHTLNRWIIWHVNYITIKLFKNLEGILQNLWEAGEPVLDCADRNNAPNYAGNWNSKDITATTAEHTLWLLTKKLPPKQNAAAGNTAIYCFWEPGGLPLLLAPLATRKESTISHLLLTASLGCGHFTGRV